MRKKTAVTRAVKEKELDSKGERTRLRIRKFRFTTLQLDDLR